MCIPPHPLSRLLSFFWCTHRCVTGSSISITHELEKATEAIRSWSQVITWIICDHVFKKLKDRWLEYDRVKCMKNANTCTFFNNIFCISFFKDKKRANEWNVGLRLFTVFLISFNIRGEDGILSTQSDYSTFQFFYRDISCFISVVFKALKSKLDTYSVSTIS